MKKLFVMMFLIAAAAMAEAQSPMGCVEEDLVIKSRILNKDVNYSIYLPPDYSHSTRLYPVLYLLHGYTDDDSGWIQFGEIQQAMDRAISEQRVAPMIIVMPDAGVSWYINNFDGSVRYEDFLVEELMPAVESSYRIRALKQYRAVAGLSMGGYGSLMLALHHPELFSGCAPLSAAIYTEETVKSWTDERWEHVAAVLYGPGLKGEKRITEHLRQNNPFYLIHHTDIEKIKSVRFWFDCGDDDRLSADNALFHVQLKQLGIPHEFRMRDGSHNWDYWRSGIVDALAFISQRFHQ